ncbi:MAG: intradiol ring-cleavage dioxygenase [Pyrinomonadaceae bacterium]
MNRRELLKTGATGVVGGAGLILLNACRGAGFGTGASDLNPGSETGPCPLNPEQEEGPFYVDEGLLRSDVLDGQRGVPLLLSIKVLRAATCVPIANAAVEIWAANSLGKYSDESQEGTVGQKYLRGVQLTDATGIVKFRTIYPGWYAGRTCHIHLKVRMGGKASGSSYATSGSHTAYVGQIFFPPTTNEALRSVYTGDNNPFTNNSDDRVYTSQHGVRGLLSLDGTMDAGFAGLIIVNVDV